MITNFEKYNINELLSIKGIIDYYKIFGSWTDIFFSDSSYVTTHCKSNIENIRYGPPNFPAKYNIDKSASLSIIKQVVNFYYDEKNIKFLGKGYFGSVYQTSDEKKVLKITRDIREVMRAEKFRQINPKGIVDYYDVREIKINRGNIFKPELWCIILEKVEPLNFYEKEIWRLFGDILEYNIKPTDKNLNFNFDQRIKTKIGEEHSKIYFGMLKMVKYLI